MLVPKPGRKHLAIFDPHIPRHNPLDSVLGYAHDTGPDHVILGGDFGNYEWASHWNEAIFKDIGRIKLREWLFAEMDAQETVLGEIRKAVGKKARLYLIPGNHEAWIWYAAFNHQFIETPFTLESITFKTDVAKLMDKGLKELLSRLLHAKKYGLEVLEYNEPLKIGKIVYLHGHQFSSGALHNATGKRWPHCNLVIGHRHTHEVVSIFNQSDPNHFYEHVSVPAMCKLAPGYEKDKSTRHSNGFWVADFDTKTGLFDGRVRKVFHGRLIPSGN